MGSPALLREVNHSHCKELIQRRKQLPAITLSPMSHEELVIAAKDGNSVECARLLEAKADPNLQDEDGNTALIGAASRGHPEVCAQLLQAKANPDLQNEYGSTALIAAAYQGRLEVCAQLLKANADPDLKTQRGDTALMRAKNQGNSEVCDLLEKALEPALEQDVNRVRSEWV